MQALVAPVTMRTSICSDRVQIVSNRRVVSGMSAASTAMPSRIFASCASASEPVANSMRTYSFTPQAALSSSVGSSWWTIRCSLAMPASVSESPPRSSSFRFARTGPAGGRVGRAARG